MKNPTIEPRAGAKHPSFRRALAVVIPAGLMAGAVMALQAHAAQDSGATITIDNFTFAPAELRVPIGTVVTWVNRDDTPHTVVDSHQAFRAKALDTDDSYSFTFMTAGEFDYFCSLHPFMTAKVVVTP